MSWVSFFVPPVRLGKGEKPINGIFHSGLNVVFFIIIFLVSHKNLKLQKCKLVGNLQHLQYSVLGRGSRQDSSVGHSLSCSDQYV